MLTQDQNSVLAQIVAGAKTVSDLDFERQTNAPTDMEIKDRLHFAAPSKECKALCDDVQKKIGDPWFDKAAEIALARINAWIEVLPEIQ